MADKFDYFVIFAEMRTGSNFLQSNLNEFPSIRVWGEIYNPWFIGGGGQQVMQNITLEMREEDPLSILNAIRKRTKSTKNGLAGFRFFHDHDPRMFDHCMKDPRCGKVILNRNPIESYVSWRIAEESQDWVMKDLVEKKDGVKATYKAPQFARMLDQRVAFQERILRGLQESGQSAFWMNYEDVQDINVINGLVKWLGYDEPRDQIATTTRVQNPEGLADKVENFDEMVADLATIDYFNLSKTPSFEPRRGPLVPSYVATPDAGLLFQPVQGGPTAVIEDWMAAVDGIASEDLARNFSQQTLKKWKRQHKGHRSFTVLRHPVARLHSVFCRYILDTGPQNFGEVRHTLREAYALPLPEGQVDESWTLEAHRAAFIAFAQFIKGNLNQQTSVRVDHHWASQCEVIQGFGQFSQPDTLIREEEMAQDLAYLAKRAGISAAPAVGQAEEDAPFSLEEVYSDEVEQAVKAAYQRDYLMYGFGRWR
ncbi:Sulfotransferase family protein [Aquimixticola soesokkakensis]|uniref:Sulfotransferase family protein n=1 Tax=Aquimixticola soesokkakensis TaxID=1519096 RepID=A0A1Y5R6S6_9RHOB|nr:sulfotransferase family 2 domain-containing protein [Aquimixticola soesokkakensis]SLN10554.1 Sulfotransferase family protein [Aquimixticola soesokkakensis]